MRKILIFVLSLLCLLLSACSPRDFLTRRLAFDLIARSRSFRVRQQFQFNIGTLSNDDYLSSENLALQHHGWISGTVVRCPRTLAPPPCWDVSLTPSGVEALQGLLAPGDAEKQSFTIPAAKRELIAITGIAKQGNSADVEFTWHWVPLNEVSAATYSGDSHYKSTASFRRYDDGWRVVDASHPSQPLDEALKNAEPTR